MIPSARACLPPQPPHTACRRPLSPRSAPPPAAMQRSGEMTVEYQAYHVVMHWLVAVPRSSRFRHMPQWTLGNQAYAYLTMSTVAWSPSRRAAVDIAMRLFMVQLRADNRDLTDEASTVDRRAYRAIMMTGMPINPRGDIVTWVRRLALEYRVDRTISAYVRHAHGAGGPNREHAVRLHRHLRGDLRQDEDSASDDAHDMRDDEDQGSSDDEV